MPKPALCTNCEMTGGISVVEMILCIPYAPYPTSRTGIIPSSTLTQTDVNASSSQESHRPDSNTSPARFPAQVLASRIISETQTSDPAVIDAITTGMLESDFNQILAVLPYGFKNSETNGTSINPNWRTGIWHAIMSYGRNFDSTLEGHVQAYSVVRLLGTNMFLGTNWSGTPNS
ncbi:hypothetical protein BJ165DRAFT_1403000 [Panaeolus papilionaceus]|nr:hypothetical protein BJ165DRAFT_1403000 [Panaeolus papilionaceus]